MLKFHFIKKRKINKFQISFKYMSFNYKICIHFSSSSFGLNLVRCPQRAGNNLPPINQSPLFVRHSVVNFSLVFLLLLKVNHLKLNGIHLKG